MAASEQPLAARAFSSLDDDADAELRYDAQDQPMTIDEFIWPEERIEHIAQHGVTPEEVEEVCFGKALVQRGKSEGENPVYYVLGQTGAGRYLFCVVIGFPDGKGYPVTAREMTDKEKRRYRRRRRR